MISAASEQAFACVNQLWYCYGVSESALFPMNIGYSYFVNSVEAIVCVLFLEKIFYKLKVNFMKKFSIFKLSF